ncbi:methyl-accepting chemotaxis protein [Saccharospirillum impatiens]|uniref:methyl-accepting chemotaxis protein n=1 Tax=Saccharospirillum impatiens TaxID=169438 RepID=UPI00040F3EFF|nr:methyl-accepting chemotaxis protein [Saccharospirillum impatiens]
MPWLKNLSIANKVRLPLLLILAITLTSTVIGVRTLITVTSSSDVLIQRYQPALLTLAEMDTLMHQALLGQRAYIQAASWGSVRDELDGYQATITADSDKALTLSREAAEVLGTNSSSVLMEQFATTVTAWQTLNTEILEFADSGAASVALQIGELEGAPLFAEALAAKNELSAQINSDSTERVQAAEAISSQAIAQSWIQLGVSLAVLVAIALWLPLSLSRPIANLRDRLNDLASGEGDLTARLASDRADEVGQLAHHFNRLMEKLHQSMSHITRVNEELQNSSHILNQASRGNISLAQQQEGALEQVVTAVEELHGSAREVASNAERGSSTANDALDNVRTGTQRAAQANVKVNELKSQLDTATQASHVLAEEATSITSVLDVIRNIAEQTNLLALNAAIEAARAGEQGRGFAVVADEVRSLAQKTQQSTADIQQRIERLQQGVDKTVSAMQTGSSMVQETAGNVSETQASFVAIEALMQDINDISAQIATATEEQSQVVSGITEHLVSISDYSKENTRHSQEIDQAADQLVDQSSQVQTVLSGYRLS